MPFCSVQLSAKRPPNPAYPKELKTIGDHLRKRRLDLGLSQKKVAATLGVSLLTITGWKLGRYGPQRSHLPAIIGFLGYSPIHHDKIDENNIVETMKRYRLSHGLSQKKFAKLLLTDQKTITMWEVGRHVPSMKLVERFSRLKIDLSS